MCCFQPNFFPSFSSICTFIHAISMMCHHTSHCMFSHTHIHYIRIALGNRNTANGRCFKKSIGNIIPTKSHIIGFPKSTTRGTHIIYHGITRNPHCRVRSTASKRSNISPLYLLECFIQFTRIWITLRIRNRCE